ncbi:MAG: Kdo domain containing protein [Winogradskyella sp.]|nr:Kdo domain containing protein [Winogradskyella sp.]
MKSVIHNHYKLKAALLEESIKNFDVDDGYVLKQSRNSLKQVYIDDWKINIKSFKKPNIFNKIIYRYFRKSKAQRSYEYALRLIELGIGTPHPIAYFEESHGLLFGRSYFISEQLQYDLTYRELITDFNYPNHEEILRAFTRFTFTLHQKGVEFKDHSPGNTLIVKGSDDYRFYLVDLNRMNFRTLDFNARMKNFARLTKYKSMVEVMSVEYAKCMQLPYDKVFNAMWNEVRKFRASFDRKRKIKKILGL